MTLTSTSSRVQYAGNGAATVWPVPFAFHGPDDLALHLSSIDDAAPLPLQKGVDYDVTGGDGESGAVVCPVSGSPHPEGKLITITRAVSLMQDLDLVNLDGFDAELIERQFDRSRMIDQQLQEQLDRCLKAPVTNPDALTFEDIIAERAAAQGASSAAQAARAGAENAEDGAMAALAQAEAARDQAQAHAASIDPALLAPADHDHHDAYEPLNVNILKANAEADLLVGYRAGTTGATEVSGAFQPTFHLGNVRRFNLTGNATLTFVAGNFGTHVYLIDRSASNFTLSFSGFDKIIGAVNGRYALVTVVAVDGRAVAFIDDVS